MATATNLPKFSSGGTVFVVGKQDVSDPSLGAFINSGDSVWINRKVTTNVIAAESANGSIMLGPVQNVTNDIFYTIRMKADAVNCLLSVNNNTESSVARDGTAISGLADSVVHLFNDYGGHHGHKTIAEVLIYTRALTGTEITLVETYLQTKYNHY